MRACAAVGAAAATAAAAARVCASWRRARLRASCDVWLEGAGLDYPRLAARVADDQARPGQTRGRVRAASMPCLLRVDGAGSVPLRSGRRCCSV